MAVGGGVAEVDGGERLVGEPGDGPLGLDLGPGVGSQGVERVVLVQVELLSLAVDGATPGEEEARHAGPLGELRQPDRGVAVDVEGDLGVHLAHRVVRDGRQVHDAVAPVQVSGVDLADVFDQLPVGLDEGFPVAALEQVEVAADDGVALLLEDVDQVGPDVTAMACGENVHDLVATWGCGVAGWKLGCRPAQVAGLRARRRRSQGLARILGQGPATAPLPLRAAPGFRPP